MLDSLAFLICACTFIPFLLLLPPALREEYCPCCCCLPSLHVVHDDEEDIRKSQEDKNCSQKSCLKIKRYIEEGILTDSESVSGGESSRRSRRSHSRSGKSKTLKQSGQKPRKTKYDSASYIRKTKFPSNSWSSEDEETGSTRWKNAATSKISRHTGKSSRGESGRRSNELQRSRSRAEKSKTLKPSVSGEESRKTKREKSSYIRNTERNSWSSEGGDSLNTNEETGSSRWKNEGTSKIGRYADNITRGDSGRRTDELRRSRSRAEKSKTLKHSVPGEEIRKTKREIASYIKNISAKRNSWSSEGGDSLNTNEETGSTWWKYEGTSKIARYTDKTSRGESGRRSNELQRSRSRAEKSKTLKPSVSGEESRKTKREKSSYIRNTERNSWSSEGGDSLNTNEETGSSRWKNEGTSKIGRYADNITRGESTRRTDELMKSYSPDKESETLKLPGEEPRKTKSYTRKTTVKSNSWSSEGEESFNIKEEIGITLRTDGTTSKLARQTNKSHLPGEETLSKEVDSSYIRKTTAESGSLNTEGGEAQRPTEGSGTHRWTNETPRATGAGQTITRSTDALETNRWTYEVTSKKEDQSPREKEDSTIHPSLTAFRESVYSLVGPSSYKEGIGSNTRWTNEGTSKISKPTEPVDEPRKCDARCHGLRISTVTEHRIPEENQRSVFDKFSWRPQVSQLRESRQEPSGENKHDLRIRCTKTAVHCGCSNVVQCGCSNTSQFSKGAASTSSAAVEATKLRP